MDEDGTERVPRERARKGQATEQCALAPDYCSLRTLQRRKAHAPCVIQVNSQYFGDLASNTCAVLYLRLFLCLCCALCTLQTVLDCRRGELADFVLLAMKAATHHVLYMRNVYPERYFQNERVLGTFTKACRHAAVKAYVSEVLDSIKVCAFAVGVHSRSVM